jgi:hypothetical protein
MTQQEFVDEIQKSVKALWKGYWDRLPDERRLRLAGIEQEMGEIALAVVNGMWEDMTVYLDELAERMSRTCECGRRCERQNHELSVKVLGATVTFSAPYFYCRHCKKGISPVRQWLGLHQGSVSMELERKTTDLTTRMTFGDAVDSLEEQHGQKMDRTQAERITYAVGQQATEYLEERRAEALSKLSAEHRTQGVDELQSTADGGFILTRKLQRPPKKEVTDPSGFTPVRKLPKATWETNGREVRFISVHEPEDTVNRKVDLHIAPHNQTEYTGERMLAAAVEAGLGDNTTIHGVFDMGRWISSQFNEQFHDYSRTLTVDIIHVTEYLFDAGRVIVGSEEAQAWSMVRKRRLLDGDIDGVLADLKGHVCGAKGAAPCIENEDKKCLVRVAQQYMENYRAYMNYPEIKAMGLAVGSGEAECGVKQMKKRMDVSGGWTEDNAKLILALITIRRSGWWDDFWQWRDHRDIEQWNKRQRGEIRSRFRGRSRWESASEVSSTAQRAAA